jgi:DNA-binding transcriptional ArsR family regulator
MLDVFLGKHYTELTRSDVAELSGLDPATVSRNIDVFVDLGVIEPTRAVGKSQLYSVNTDADLVKALGKARDELRQHGDRLNDVE